MKKLKLRNEGSGYAGTNGGGSSCIEGDGYICQQEGVGFAVRREGWDG